jgi:hypothetical protein
VPICPPAPSAARFAQIMVPTRGGPCRVSSASQISKCIDAGRGRCSGVLDARTRRSSWPKRAGDRQASATPRKSTFRLRPESLSRRRSRVRVPSLPPFGCRTGLFCSSAVSLGAASWWFRHLAAQCPRQVRLQNKPSCVLTHAIGFPHELGRAAERALLVFCRRRWPLRWADGLDFR